MTRHILLPVLMVLLVQRCTAQDRCSTPENRPGLCINARNCPAVVQLCKTHRPLTREIQNYLRSLQCGFEGRTPKVCCAQQPVITTEPPPTSTESPSPQVDLINVSAPPDVSNHPNLHLINEDSCGPVYTQKIIGGSKTGVFEFPWMALLGYDSGNGVPDFKCGGTLINKRYVLTAAHCVTRLPSGTRLIGVRIGEHDLSTERDCDKNDWGLQVACAERYQDFGLESVHFHPDYTPKSAQNDIALLRLNADADYRPKNVRPICLPVGFNSTLPRKKMVVTGWGKTESGMRSQALLQVKLTIATLPNCAQAYKGKAQIWHKQLCAGGSRIADACTGDSGGPLQLPTLFKDTVKSVQFGIVSFGQRGCAIEGVPGVYTNVVYYIDWILGIVRP
ncbi:melanization protease 1-like [Lasioglossum baleicum]|uniref:melanization protease 1-like n=1 Tax=Lasioglossum baleicum TaxID=434251 RepID=UPI003FCDF935